MTSVGRRLEMKWNDKVVVVLEVRNDIDLEENNSRLLDLIDFPGIGIITKELHPLVKPYGQDLNTCMERKEFWIDENECELLNKESER